MPRVRVSLCASAPLLLLRCGVLVVEVAESDLGKIIGRGGKTARALRTLVQAIAPRSRKRTLVEILE